MQFLWKYIDDLVGKGLEMHVIAELLMYTSASLVSMALPLAVLLASIMTFGNLAEYNELLALKSAGIPLQKIMAPVMVLTLFITISAFLFSNYVLPYSNLKMRSLLYDIQRQNPELQIKVGIFDNTIDGYSIRIEERDSKTNLLKNIQIYDHTDHQGNTTVTLADSGYMRMTADEQYLLFTLYNGITYSEMRNKRKRRVDRTYPHRRDKFEEQDMIIELLDFGLKRTDESLFKSSYQMMNLSQLAQIEDSLVGEISVAQKSLIRTLDASSYTKEKSYLVDKRPKDLRDGIKSYELERPGKDSSFHEADSIVNEKIVQQINLDSSLNSLPENKRKNIINQAINNSRTAVNYISNANVNIDTKVRRLRKYQIEEQRKFSLSMACLIFFFIGAPLGAIIRKGGLGMPVVVSVLFFLLYYIISLTSEKFVRESVLSPYIGMWISSFILIPLGIFLTYKASTDSVIMNVETYFQFFKNLRHLFKKRSKPGDDNIN